MLLMLLLEWLGAERAAGGHTLFRTLAEEVVEHLLVPLIRLTSDQLALRLEKPLSAGPGCSLAPHVRCRHLLVRRCCLHRVACLFILAGERRGLVCELSVAPLRPGQLRRS